MQKSGHELSVSVQRARASWRMRACVVGLCAGAQVFITGAGAAMPLCLNAAWIASLAALPITALAVYLCHRALKRRSNATGLFARALHALLCAAFALDAAFAVAALVGLAEQSLLPQTRAAHSVLMTVIAVIAAALSGKGAERLGFALRLALPIFIAVLCAVSLPLNSTVGLFPVLGAGASWLLPGSVCMLSAAFPALLLLFSPQELEGQDDRLPQDALPNAWFFVWRAVLGAAAGTALLLALTLGSTYESIDGSDTWGERLLIISSGRPREGLAQTGLTILEILAMLLLAVYMLLGAQRAAACAWPRLGESDLALAPGAALLCLLLAVLFFVGFDMALYAAPCLLVPLALALAFHRKLGGSHGS